jgi:tryptophan-rich sensory protein
VTSALAVHRANLRRRSLSPSRQLAVVALFLLATFAAAGLGSIATAGTTDSAWFRALDKPSWYPPSATFGVVWTVLYVMIAASGAIAWRRGAPPSALTAWVVQLALNLGWTTVFFGLRLPGWALVEIVVLLAAIAITIALFWPVDRLASWLLVPYLAWVAFASVLNGAICWLNR